MGCYAAACVDESDHALMYVWHGQTVKEDGGVSGRNTIIREFRGEELGDEA